MTTKTEDKCYSKEFDVRGYIDYTDNANGEVRIIDYKTSARFETTKEQRMQLAIYAYLYEKQHGIRPDKVGIYFLREKLHLISVDNSMINYAEEECRKIYEKTQSRNIGDYPQNKGYLCKRLGANCPCHRYEEQEG